MGSVISTQYRALAPVTIVSTTQFENAKRDGSLNMFAQNTYYRQGSAEGSGAGKQLYKWTSVHSSRSFRIYPFSIRSMVGAISRLLAVFDELGDAPGSEVFDTYRTGQSGALLTVISTQGKVGSPMHNHVQQLQHMKKSSRYNIHVRAADAVACRTIKDMGDEAQWRAANPLLGSPILTYDAMRADYDLMVRNGVDAEIQRYREKRLNVPVLPSHTADLFTTEQIQACGDPGRQAAGPCQMGIDLAQVNDFCAVSFYWPDTHKMLLHCFVPGKEDLAYYAQKVDYPLGDLLKAGYVSQNREEDYISFLDVSVFILKTLKDFHINPGEVLCGSDHYKLSSFRRTLAALNLIEGVDFPLLVKVRQSSIYMGNMVTNFRNLARNGDLHIDGIDLLIHALRAAHVARDSQLNTYFKRENQYTERIDPLIAAILSVNVEDYLWSDAGVDERERAYKLMQRAFKQSANA